MQPTKEAALEWERRWAKPVAIATLAAVGLVIAAVIVATQGVGSHSGEAAVLRAVDQHRSAQIASSILQAIGLALLAAPLYYLFRAAQLRSSTMRGQLVGVVVAAPLFLAALAIFSCISTLHAATDFVSNEMPKLVAEGAALNGDHANKVASDAVSSAPLRPLAAGFGFGGQLGFVIAMIYTCLHAMRVGLLTRFWGSAGIALGAVSFIFFQFALLWYIYPAFLLLDFVPGGRPRAWATGEAIPWPSAGEKASAALGDGGGPAIDVDAPEQPEPGERRKRKQRD